MNTFITSEHAVRSPQGDWSKWLVKSGKSLIQVAALIILLGRVETGHGQGVSSNGLNLINASITNNAIVSMGDTTRLSNLMMRARRGDSLTIAVIGGSITGGAITSNWTNQYGMIVFNWWKTNFPGATFTYVNAGVGGTGSDCGVMRAQRDLLSKKPDFVITEFAVNDPNNVGTSRTIEGLTRQILAGPG